MEGSIQVEEEEVISVVKLVRVLMDSPQLCIMFSDQPDKWIVTVSTGIFCRHKDELLKNLLRAIEYLI